MMNTLNKSWQLFSSITLALSVQAVALSVPAAAAQFSSEASVHGRDLLRLSPIPRVSRSSGADVNLEAMNYEPPDNGGPTTSEGAGTR